MSAAFLSPLQTVHLNVGMRKALTAPLVYRDSHGNVYEIPAGYYSDGGSVPRLLWPLYPPFGDDTEAAFWLHDRMYSHAELYHGTDHGHVSRLEADSLLYEALEVIGLRWSARQTIFRGVRLGGWRPWGRYRKEARVRLAAERFTRPDDPPEAA